jgi:predicted RNA-binding Zn-ribbon protein involved in translation (DUF1610 family)
MSRNIEYFTYTERKSTKAIENELNSYAAREGDGGGLPGKIKFIDKVFPDYGHAVEFIKSNNTYNYDCMAVKYKALPEGKSTKKLDELRIRRHQALEEYRNMSQYVVAKDFKSEFVGCKDCGSKINREYIKSNACPVCGKDMRSDTIQKRLLAMREKVEKLEKAIDEEQEKLFYKSGKVYWLVKIEYHS